MFNSQQYPSGGNFPPTGIFSCNPTLHFSVHKVGSTLVWYHSQFHPTMTEFTYVLSQKGKKNILLEGKTFAMRGTPKRTKDGEFKELWKCTNKICCASLSVTNGKIVRSTADKHVCGERQRGSSDLLLIRFRVSSNNQ